VIAPDVGGGFGSKIRVYPEEILVALAAWKLGRPVRWVAGRSEDTATTVHAHGTVMELELAAGPDGRLRGLRGLLAHDAGAEAQIDFGKRMVRIAGVDTVVQLFCARLAYSTRDVVRAYRRQDRAAWLDGHVHAFSTWGGVPAVIWYDNPSGLGSFRQGKFTPCDEFLALQSAYGFRAHHCTPGEGHEKGLVEGLVGYARRTYLVPVPEVLEVRRGSVTLDRPGLLMTSYLPGERGDLLLPTLDDTGLATLGARLGDLLADLESRELNSDEQEEAIA